MSYRPSGRKGSAKRIPRSSKRRVKANENLDVLGPSQEHAKGKETTETQSNSPAPIYRVGGGGVTDSFSPPSPPRGNSGGKQYRIGGTDRLTLPQADNLAEAVAFADQIGLTLRAHLTVHPVLTFAYADRDGRRAAKVREGLNKLLHRRGVPGGLTGVWVRECKAQTDVSHDHLLFHLPLELCTADALRDLTASILRLVGRHGGGVTSRKAVDLTLYRYAADGRYLLKGGGREVWEKYRLPSSWRRMQGRIHGKRCGTTQNIGPAARLRTLIEDAPLSHLRYGRT